MTSPKLCVGVGLFALLLLLGGCTHTPYIIYFGVINDYIGRGTFCTDGLEGNFVLQGAKIESGLIAPGESIGIDLITPEGASPGTVMTTEAWCYRDGEEVGYIRIERPYRYSSIPLVDVFPSSAEGELDYPLCTEPTEARGVPICVDSQLYD